jgi:hypothetical protein
MKVEVKKYIQGDEVLESLHFKDDKDTEYLVVPFYVNKETIDAEPNLKFGIEYLPKLLKDVYTLGQRNEPLEIVTEEINV